MTRQAGGRGKTGGHRSSSLGNKPSLGICLFEWLSTCSHSFHRVVTDSMCESCWKCSVTLVLRECFFHRLCSISRIHALNHVFPCLFNNEFFHHWVCSNVDSPSDTAGVEITGKDVFRLHAPRTKRHGLKLFTFLTCKKIEICPTLFSGESDFCPLNVLLIMDRWHWSPFAFQLFEIQITLPLLVWK